MGIMVKLFGGPGFFEARRQFAVAATQAKAALAEIKAAARDDDSDRPPERDSDDYEPAPVSVALHG